MPELDDIASLGQFAENGSEPAFARIVSRHLNIVHSTALRATNDTHAAQEISQAVFIILARKANKLPRHAVLSGWLYQTTRLTAANYLRTEIRRRNREQEAFMQSTLNEAVNETWLQIAPILDEAISKLGAKDRDAVVLRFFENKSLSEVGAALGASEDAAKMRVNRALEKLRKFFAKRGVTLSAGIIATAVSANSVQAAPVGLAKTVTAVAIVKGSITSASTLTLVKGALKIMAWTKMRTAIVAGAGILLAAGTAMVVLKESSQPSDPWMNMDNIAPTVIRIMNKFKPAMDRMDDNAMGPAFKHNKEMIDKENKEIENVYASFFKKAPSGIIIQPTHFGELERGSARHGDQMIGKVVPFSSLLAIAYETNGQDFSPARIIFPKNILTGNFDYLVNVSGQWQEKFQAQIKRQFGLIGRMETRETSVLALTVNKPDVVSLLSLSESQKTVSHYNAGIYETITGDTTSLADILETRFFHQPILDKTANRVPGMFFYALPLDSNDLDSVRKALLDQLGLELVPSREPVEMLVVEKVK